MICPKLKEVTELEPLGMNGGHLNAENKALPCKFVNNSKSWFIQGRE